MSRRCSRSTDTVSAIKASSHDRAALPRASITMNLAHGAAVDVLRGLVPARRSARIHSRQPAVPLTPADRPMRPSFLSTPYWNRAFPDPQCLGVYPPRGCRRSWSPTCMRATSSASAGRTDWFGAQSLLAALSRWPNAAAPARLHHGDRDRPGCRARRSTGRSCRPMLSARRSCSLVSARYGCRSTSRRTASAPMDAAGRGRRGGGNGASRLSWTTISAP